ncbi:DUF4238 domain-containing protein [Paraburkholderia guartelaensis]|uniref:DUF4238 domain-containing protein n=1 Tax=Paraburkholderia guartelaensis TaxID=2546446 RepID=A0A4R5L867_9BURK|nr:DUF4238 domain-containing protein [Paraburkholderia guartelaensis]TDG05116.1 DUF4238 domain-containing protein [Paraburkholderia guartelaensis]
MATNKNQHLVPRCYLKPFTRDEGNATIKLFNIDRKRFVPTAPVKNQCSGSYFYGQDPTLEEAIQSCESAYASLLRKIRGPGYSLDNEDKCFLRYFWLVQHLRTEAASRRSVEEVAEAESVIGGGSLSFAFGIKEAVLMAMDAVAEAAPIIDDLKVCLLKNRTGIPFVTSDDPAIASNRWYLEDRRTVGCSFGINASGLITLLPLTPEILCLAYDGDVYSVQHEHGWVQVRNAGDVRALNQHQILNCFANLYLPETASEEDARSQYADCAHHRLAVRHKLNYAVPESEHEGYVRFVVTEADDSTRKGEALLHLQTLHPKPTRWPSLLRSRKPGAVYANGTAVNYVRERHALAPDSINPFRKERAW